MASIYNIIFAIVALFVVVALSSPVDEVIAREPRQFFGGGGLAGSSATASAGAVGGGFGSPFGGGFGGANSFAQAGATSFGSGFGK